MRLGHTEHLGHAAGNRQRPRWEGKRSAGAGAFAAFTIMAGSVLAADMKAQIPDCRTAFSKAAPAEIRRADSAAAAFRDSAGGIAVPVVGTAKEVDTIYAMVKTLVNGARAVVVRSTRCGTADTFQLADVEAGYARLAGRKPAGFRLIPEAYYYWHNPPTIKIRAVPAGSRGMNLEIPSLPYGIIRYGFEPIDYGAMTPRWESHSEIGCVCKPGPRPRVPDLAALPTLSLAALNLAQERVFAEIRNRDTLGGVVSSVERWRGHVIRGCYPTTPLGYGNYEYTHTREFYRPGGSFQVIAFAMICDDSTCTDNAELDYPFRYLVGIGPDNTATMFDLTLMDSLFRRATGRELGNVSIIADTAAGGGLSAILLPNDNENRLMKDVPAMRVTVSPRGRKTEYFMVRE